MSELINNLMSNPIARHTVGLLILMSVNIVLGSIGSLFVGHFNARRFCKSLVKSGIIILCFIATYYAGYLNPDIIAISVGDVEANVMTALNLIVLFGYYHYAKQVIEKLAAMLGLNFDDEIKGRGRRKD